MYLCLTSALGITSIFSSQINTIQRKLYTSDSISFHLLIIPESVTGIETMAIELVII